MKNQLRMFIAVSLSPSVLPSIEKMMRILQANVEGVHWVEPKNLHITLKFLGDVPLNDLPQLIRAVTQSVETTPSFDLAFHGFGVFPSRASPKTIWIGCREGSEELGQIAERINEGLLPLGFPREARRFSAHLTIGRIKRAVQHSPLIPLLDEQQDRSFGSCSVSEVQIFSSELTRRGSIYDELAAIPLL
jgi:2'-5' RNA ligase